MDFQIIAVIVVVIFAIGYVIKTVIRQFSSSEVHAECEKCCTSKSEKKK
ncbi:MAG: hypothetical protein GXO91_07635 [FCB group bacterium]|nr:hypothetical protein [FCB group bacterium]